MNEHEAGPVLNRLIAEVVMGWTLYHYDKGGPSDAHWSLLDGDCSAVLPTGKYGWRDGEHASEEAAFAWFRPSADIAHAWQVVERMADLRHVFLVKADGYREPDNAPRYTVLCGNQPRTDSESAPLAICLAALRAVGGS